MPFITLSNSKAIIRALESKALLKHFKPEDVYKEKILLLTVSTKVRLVAYKALITNSHSLILKVYQNRHRDSENWVFGTSKPAFHRDFNCEYLQSNYRNVRIPESIKLQGPNKVAQFKSWVFDNLTQGKHVRDMKNACIKEFNLTEEEFYGEEKLNTGRTNMTASEILDVESQIDVLLRNAEAFQNRSDKHKQIIHFVYNLKARVEYDNPIYKQFRDEIEFPLQNELYKWLQLTYNPDLDLAQEVLEALGFKGCVNCWVLEESY